LFLWASIIIGKNAGSTERKRRIGAEYMAVGGTFFGMMFFWT
jgi:hypothetical protein